MLRTICANWFLLICIFMVSRFAMGPDMFYTTPAHGMRTMLGPVRAASDDGGTDPSGTLHGGAEIAEAMTVQGHVPWRECAARAWARHVRGKEPGDVRARA
eukprot:COSAG01_NODE_8267_length_2851_cov_7.531613_1_plen_101_part_00